MAKFFISYVYEDGAHKDQLAQWAKSGQLLTWQAVYEDADVRQDGKKKVQDYLSPLIQSCHAMVLLVGDNSHNHPWLDYEVQNARSGGKTIVVVRLPNTTGGPPSSIPSPNVKFAPAAILAALNSVAW